MLQTVKLKVTKRWINITMSRKSRDNPAIRDFIIENVESHPDDIASLTATEFGISRMTANRYLDKLTSKGIIIGSGETRARQYRLIDFVKEVMLFDVTPQTEEHIIWREKVAPKLQNVRKNVLEILE